MGSIRKATFTKAIPEGAELFTRKGQQFARWQPARGKARTAPVRMIDGQPRIVITAKTYTAKYRDAAGIIQHVATGCRDEQAARSIAQAT